MNLCRLTFELDGHEISVTGYHHKGCRASLAGPAEPESFSIWTSEITRQADPDEPVSIDDLDEDDLSAASLRAWRERDEFERCLYADMCREDAWLERRAHR